MTKAKVVVNPAAGRGYSGRAAPEIDQHLRRLGVDFELTRTGGPGDAVMLARRAQEEGFDIVVAVGGDGTTHEVVNGLMMGGTGVGAGMPTLACIPTGSGNDFAAMNGAPENLAEACQLIAEGGTRVVDVARVIVDDEAPEYSSNTIGIGFDGLVTCETKNWRYVRGMALYIPAVLKTIFVTLQPMRVEVTYDGKVLHRTAMMTVIANGPREGHTFYVAPNAECDDGLLDFVVVEHMSKLRMLSMIPRFMQGTHIRDHRVTEGRAKKVAVASEDPLCIHLDGEIVSEAAHRIEVEIIPHCLRMIGRPINEEQSS